jgi:outer membrane protein assembly factor BamB
MSRVKNLEMHRTLLPKILLSFLICLFLPSAPVFAQTKAVGEVDVSKCWSYPMPEVGSGLVSDGNRVFLGASGAKVESLSLDGKKMWSTELGGDISSNILALDGGLFLVTSTVSMDAEKSGGSVLRGLSKETGITSWTIKLPDAERHFVGGFNGSVVVVSKSGVIQSVDSKTGAMKWKREIAEGFVAQPVFSGDKVLVGTTGKQIFGVSLSSGEIDSMRRLPFGITSMAEFTPREIIVGDDRGNVHLLNGTYRAPWKFKSGGEISNILTIGEHVLATSHDNFVYFLQVRNGDVTWKRRMNGRVSRIGSILDKYTLIASVEENTAVLADLSNGKVAGQILFAEGENLVSEPFASSGLIFVLTNRAAYAYSLNGCATNK